MTTNSADITTMTNQSNESQHEELLDQVVLLPGPTYPSTVNSREFVEKSDEILSSTNKLTINLFSESSFESDEFESVYHVFNRAGENVFTIRQCPESQRVQKFIICNSAGLGLMSFTTKNMVCDVDGAGLLSFTQIQHFHGGYTLRDPYKELVKIRSGWIPFCTCCLQLVPSATMTITDLDGTETGSIFFEKSNSELNVGTVSLNFIPNLNPKAKYMLLAASIKLICCYFHYLGRRRRSRWLVFSYTMLILLFLTVCSVLVVSL